MVSVSISCISHLFWHFYRRHMGWSWWPTSRVSSPWFQTNSPLIFLLDICTHVLPQLSHFHHYLPLLEWKIWLCSLIISPFPLCIPLFTSSDWDSHSYSMAINPNRYEPHDTLHVNGGIRLHHSQPDMAEDHWCCLFPYVKHWPRSQALATLSSNHTISHFGIHHAPEICPIY